MDRVDRSRQALAICLAVIAGYIDAIGYLSADSYFVSFMSGNTTRLGVDLASDWPGAAAPALLIAGFVTGVAIGRAIANCCGAWRKPAVLGAVFLLLSIAAVVDAAGLPLAMLALLVLAMGAINNALQRGDAPIGVTYMTGALVRFGQGLGDWLSGEQGGERGSGWLPYLLLWMGLAGGAIAGAFAGLALAGQALWPAVGATALLVVAAWRLARKTA